MSYTEYLRRKAAAAPVIVDTRPKMDASTYTRHARVAAAVGSYQPKKGVIGNIDDMNPAILRDGGLTQRTQVSTTKTSGGSVPDASIFTDFVAGAAAAKDYANGPPRGKVVLNGSLTGMTSLSNCVPVSAPTPQSSGVLAPNQVQKSAGDWVRLNKDCVGSGRLGESHEPGMKGTPQFVDDTISLNSGAFRIGTGSYGSTGSTVQSSNGSSSGCPPANHSHPAIVPFAAWSARPAKGAGGIPVSVQPRPSDARKVGGLVPSDHLKYVEGHHGNDFNVNPRRVPKKFQIPGGTPAQLKINDPKKLV